MYHFHNYSSIDKLNEALTTAIIEQLEEAISLRGSASLAVSGGKTPIRLFVTLNQKLIDWSKITITLVDDRWVDENHEASNARLVKTHLLQGCAKKAHFVSIKNDANTPFDGEKNAEKLLRERVPLPIDVLILGMGDDGHTASLFPHTENLASGLDMHSGRLLIGVTPPNTPYDRISMTLPLILSCRHIYLHIVGENKKQVLKKALQNNDNDSMPIRAILQQNQKLIEIYWAE